MPVRMRPIDTSPPATSQAPDRASGGALSDICVVVTAFDAADSIARAVGSALAQPEVCEVIVVDDASADATASAAALADDGSGRLRVIRLDRNQGPAAARNLAIAASKAPFLAILDADDYLLPGRFSQMANGSWDMLADNIAFVPDPVAACETAVLAALPPGRRPLTLREFVERNIPHRGRPRSELGFLKPVIRRASLDRLKLRYDPALRLGEDFILYATALARGARFELSQPCGYVAVVRAESLSGRHRTADLAALARADAALADELLRCGAPAADRRVLARHRAALAQKVATRVLLDRKHEVGLVRAAAGLLGSPAQLVRAATELAGARLRRRPGPPPPALRLLFGPAEFAEPAPPR